MSLTCLAGHALGLYEIVEQIGAGGMATAYRAYQPSVQRYVAIKVMAPRLAQDKQFLSRFQRQARQFPGLSIRAFCLLLT